MCGSAARIAALKRSRCPTCRMRALGGARDQGARLFGVSVMGFSTSTCAPAARKASAISKCAGVGVTTLTASTLPSSSR